MNKEKNFWLWIILIVASLGLIYLFRKILLFVVLAAVVGFIGDPIVDQLEKIKMGKFKLPRWAGALVTLIMIDNAPYHRSAITKDFAQRMSLPLMFLGPYQFAMAPVEKFFAFIKARDLNPLMSKAYSK